MWSFSNAISFLFGSITKFSKLINGLSAYSKDTFLEVKELFMNSEPIDMRNGISDMLCGMSLAFWVSVLVNLITCIVTGFSGLFGTILGVLISGLINAIILQAMYNHREGWGPLVAKIFCVLIILNIVFSILGILTNVFSFSILGIINLIGELLSVLAYSLVLKGLLE